MNQTPFRLRAAVKQDAGVIRQLVLQGGINPTGLKWPRFVVAETPAGEVIACGQVKPHLDGSRELASLVVRPDWRGQGAARAVIEYLLSQHPGEIYLMCRSGLGAFYARFGFYALQTEEMPRYFQRIKRLVRLAEFMMKGETLLVMKLEA